MRKIYLLLFILFLFSSVVFSQSNIKKIKKDSSEYPYWIEMMQDPQANYYKTVRAFNLYWNNHKITRSSGYKPFKRWEYYWGSRLNPDGTRKLGIHDYKVVAKFLEKYKSKGYEGDFVNLGPIAKPQNNTGQPNGNGRVNAIAFHPYNPNYIYVGAPAGGLWISKDGGQSWESHTDVLPVLGVSSIVVDHQNTLVIYIGTGDRDAGDSKGIGVFKSVDGGVTFSPANNGMENATVGRLIMDPDDNNVLLAATDKGIFKTIDGADTWVKKKTGNFKEIVFKPGSSTTVYASKSGDFYKSTDGGETWIKNYNTGNHSRAVIAVTPINPDVVYFVTVDNSVYGGTYKSTDSGETWELKSNTPNIMSWGCNGGSGGQGWYDLDAAVDPENENIIYVGGVNVFKSTDGGSTWNINSHWVGNCGVPGVHADCHVLEFNILNNKFYAGNDGGLYYTEDGGASWPEISNGLAIGQVYRIGQSAQDKERVINGYQDNGTALYVGDNQPFLTVMGGDGMDCVYDHQDPQFSYGECYNGQGITRIKNDNYDGGISDGISESGAWVTPFILDVDDATTMYVGMKNIWKGYNVRTNNVTWTTISDDGNDNIRVIEQSEKNTNILYFARYSNKGFFRTDNLHANMVSWTALKDNLPEQGEIKDIETSPFDENVVYIALNDKVYKSIDKGETWENITLNIPDISINTIEYYKNDIEGLYVGTDAGIFYKNASMNEWILFSNGFPLSVNTLDIEIYYEPDNPADDLVRVSTYGRGLWSSPTWYGPLNADFEANDTLIPLGCELNFTDKSTGVPHSWHWTFEGGTPPESFDKNPTIKYNSEGVFQVKLEVSNPQGDDVLVKSGYIHVGQAVKPNVNFVSSNTAICQGEKVFFEDKSTGCPDSWTWNFSPQTFSFVDGTDEHSKNPVVKFNDVVAYDVILTVGNIAGDTTIVAENYVMSGGYGFPYLEEFETENLIDAGWSVVNADGKKTWEITSVTGVDDSETNSAYINLFKYYYTGQRDQLISPPLNLTGIDYNLHLTFDYAYAQRYAQVDSLIVKVSTDCGNTWTRIYANGPDMTENFVTTEPVSDNFIPQAKEDWSGRGNYGEDSPMLDLTTWEGQSGVKIMFESYCGYGNNLYIDNVKIYNVVGVKNNEHKTDVRVFPNPVSEILFVDVGSVTQNSVLIIRNVAGVQVEKLTLQSGINRININDLPKGVFIVQILNNDQTYTSKIIKN